MPTTASRWWTIPLAVDCWRAQTYPYSELAIVVDGDEYLPAEVDPHGTQHHITSLWEPHEDIRYVHIPRTRTLGQKYNECIKLSRHSWVALWADDDWHGPDRLERTAKLIKSGVGVIGDYTYITHDLNDGRTRRYVYPWGKTDAWGDKQKPYIVSGTMAFRRELGLQYPFPSRQKGSDDFFVRDLLTNTGFKRIEQPPYFYVGMSHTMNVSSFVPKDDPRWEPFDEDLATIMKGDLAKYQAAFAQLVSP
jgi:glycosyltransferase involved in cell wall biosynthesis